MKYRLSAVVSKAMERPTRDGSGSGGAMVPATSSMVPTTGVPATNPAGTNPTPMTVDDGIFYQPVQNNPTYINEGNIDLFRQEAEERHSQIMEQLSLPSKNEYRRGGGVRGNNRVYVVVPFLAFI